MKVDEPVFPNATETPKLEVTVVSMAVPLVETSVDVLVDPVNPTVPPADAVPLDPFVRTVK
jgi:hypothetical protein